ncbi:putative glutamyl-tRNA synthetase, cytoplasmic [Glarea lozoyensis 74030]|uniref:glutamate--tRNA ligase n=1 Tax=Glarea lozoyensis (strain ATCC 74030 / MF5533) TaxID=1104152 RepID=H0EQH4_GLAL7|nr:putative glutamyl-tRNA synthetase, cytoplasmic [Glarea lozoyensis 74030]
MEFQDAILEDLDGKAFADDSELGKGDEDRKIRLPSKRRDLSIEETLKYFTEMKAGSKEGLRWCIRARIAYDSPNGTLRDPVIYRCNPIPGMTVPALREFILKQGPSRNILNLEWGALWALNKKYTDHDAARHTAIVQADAVTCRVLGVDDQNIISKPKYIKNLELGTKKVVQNKAVLLEQIDAQGLEEGEEITLMNWGNAYVRRIVRDESGQKSVTEINLELHLEGDVKKTKKLSWLAAVESNLVPVDIVSFDYLITKDKLEKTDKLENFLASNTELRTQAFADCNVKELAKGAIIQFERKGYYKLDVAYGEGERMVFFDIPSGKT